MQKSKKVKFVSTDNNKFFITLKKRIDNYFKENNISRYGNRKMVVKSIVILSIYIVPFILLLAFQPSLPISLLLWAIMGFGVAGIGMSIMHDAVHGAYSSNSTVNNIMGRSLNMLGNSVSNWKLQHNILHHTYTNITNHDEDIEDKLVFRFTPHKLPKGLHKLQFIYAFFFYGVLTLYWVVAKDFVQFFKHGKKGLNKNFGNRYKFVFRLIGDKLLYFFILLIVPVYFFEIPFLQVLSGFFLMHFISGLILTTIFQLAHTVEGTTYPMPDSDGNIYNDWAIHQLNTTVNFARDNKLVSWYIGGLNFQVEHHLFPNICHVHYPEISKIVKKTAEEHGVPYLENDTLLDAFKSHLRALKKFGKLPQLNEALG
jgi:linoleoyl-CoA desaturase